MSRRRLFLLACAILAAALTSLPVERGVGAATDRLPPRLTDQEFWRLVSTFSEADGTFHSDNLLSNEARFQYVVPALTRRARPRRAYLGVGPEQNFTYIAALRPTIAFIVDIRRGNLDLHLLYKALFELSADRAEFVSRLFSKARPPGLTSTATAAEIFAAYAGVETSQGLYDRTIEAVRHQLVRRHGFPLRGGDLEGIEFVHHAFFVEGPAIQYRLNGGFGGFGSDLPSYADLMAATDGSGRHHSYLSSEATFTVLKDLETRNLLIPVVGNFAGPKAIRGVARYLKERDATVSAFYVSNVEQYLRQDGIWEAFCANVAALPLDETSTFIRSSRTRFGPGPFFSTELGAMSAVASGCGAARR